MIEKSNQNLEKSTKSSSIFKTFTSFLLLFLIIHQSSSQSATNQTITGVCHFYNDPQKGYTCTLTNITSLNSTDILEVTGTHLKDHTDDDVTAVFYAQNVNLFFNGEILRKFKNLRHLTILDQGLVEYSQNAFDVCLNLEELIIGLDNVTKLPQNMLKNCENLKYFTAIGYKLRELPEDLFGDTRNLEEFLIPGNQLTSLPEKLLQNMSNLRIFGAQENQLRELSPNIFINALNLLEVNVSKNNFDYQPSLTNALNGLTNLDKLDLSANDFPNFDFTFFSQFTKLKELTVGSKVGPEMTKISWSSLPASLIDLTVYEVGEDLPIHMCNQLVNLKSLSVSGYGIKNIHKDTFKSLGHLEMLSVQDTRVKALDPELFAGLTSLSDLNLNYNYLDNLPVGIFAPLVNIGSKSDSHGIHMYSNSIKRLNANFFGQHPYLRYIDFSLNLMEEIERGIFSKFHSNMTQVNLRGNSCTDLIFTNAVNLDNDDRLNWCFSNWAGITTTTTKSDESTTPGGCGNNFNIFEIFMIIFIGFVNVLVGFIRQ